MSRIGRPKIVVVGAGFGGLAAVAGLVRSDAEILLIDRRNYHLFQPLLYQVATADLSPAEIAWPIRSIFSTRANVRVLLAEVTGIDVAAREVIAAGKRHAYDHLVLATGSGNSYFGHDEWEPHAPGLKRIIDATEIRKRILVAFERAESADDPAEQRRQLTFLVIGGGPTGVELAGAIAELARVALARDFRCIDPAAARIVLAEAGARLLPAFAPALSDYALQALRQLGVEVRLRQPVAAIDAQGATIGEEKLPAATMMWAAGVRVPAVGRWLGADTDRGGRVTVDAMLALPGHPEISIIGDAARVIWHDDVLVPGLAPAAKQQGQFVARKLAAAIGGRAPPAPFRYRHVGSLATIGRNAAVADLGWVRLRGWPAWWFWGLVHIYFLISVRAATLVLLQWFWIYLTRRKGARLITGLRPLFGAEPEREPGSPS